MRLGARQHFGCVDVLPPGVANINAANLVIFGHKAHSVGKTAVAPAAAGLRSLQVIEDFDGTNEHSSIDRVVIAQMFSDCDDLVAVRLNFHRIIDIENCIQLSVDRDIELVKDGLTDQKIDN